MTVVVLCALRPVLRDCHDQAADAVRFSSAVVHRARVWQSTPETQTEQWESFCKILLECVSVSIDLDKMFDLVSGDG